MVSFDIIFLYKVNEILLHFNQVPEISRNLFENREFRLTHSCIKLYKIAMIYYWIKISIARRTFSVVLCVHIHITILLN